MLVLSSLINLLLPFQQWGSGSNYVWLVWSVLKVHIKRRGISKALLEQVIVTFFIRCGVSLDFLSLYWCSKSLDVAWIRLLSNVKRMLTSWSVNWRLQSLSLLFHDLLLCVCQILVPFRFIPSVWHTLLLTQLRC